MIRKLRWTVPILFLALAFDVFQAAAARAESPERPIQVAARIGGSSAPHVYLLRGLLNVFSLGMDDLGEKLNRRGIPATVTGYTGWETLADEIAAQYKAGRHGPIILIGHSFGADAVMNMGAYLGRKGVPVALIVPFDASGPIAAAPGVQRVMNLTQREYAKMTRGPGFKGELVNIDLTKDQNIGHLNVDKSPRLHAMVIRKIQSVIGGGGREPATAQKPQPVKLPMAKPAADPIVTSNVAASAATPPPPPAPVSAAPVPPPAVEVSRPAADAAAPPPKPKHELPD